MKIKRRPRNELFLQNVVCIRLATCEKDKSECVRVGVGGVGWLGEWGCRCRSKDVFPSVCVCLCVGWAVRDGNMYVYVHLDLDGRESGRWRQIREWESGAFGDLASDSSWAIATTTGVGGGWLDKQEAWSSHAAGIDDDLMVRMEMEWSGVVWGSKVEM